MSTTHLFGGSAKAWQPPSFSKEEPRQKFKQSFSQPLFASFQLSTTHPDEEKGRSLRSTTRIPSNPTTFFSQPIVGLEEAFELSDDLEDSAFFDSWRADRRIDGEGEDNVGDLAQALKVTSTREETETPSRINSNDAVEWTKVLSHAVDNSDGNVDLRSALPVSPRSPLKLIERWKQSQKSHSNSRFNLRPGVHSEDLDTSGSTILETRLAIDSGPSFRWSSHCRLPNFTPETFISLEFPSKLRA